MIGSFKITILGDLFPTPINYSLFSSGDINALFGEKILNIIQQSDFSICNLEGVFTAENNKPKEKDGPNIRAPKECVNAFRLLGIDCVSLSNNHIADYGIEGVLDTYSTLDKAGIKYFGSGTSIDNISTHYDISINGKRITFYGVSETVENIPTEKEPGVNLYDEYRVCNEIFALKSECDLLIVLYHGGIENTHFNTSSIRTRFHRMADSGADIIIAQHTHAIGAEENYNKAYLLYGQGNFCFNFSKRLHEWVETGLLLEIIFSQNHFSIVKHIVRRTGPGITYDKDQDFTEFYTRSKRLSENDSFDNEIREYASKKLPAYLNAFRGENYTDKIMRKLLSKEKYYSYMKKKYKKKHILKMLLALQSEEFREVATIGLQNLLDEGKETDGK